VNPAGRPPRGILGTGAAAVGACAACCAGPILAVLGGLSFASVVGAMWIPALAVATAATLAAIAWVLRRRRRVDACHADDAPLDLGMPGRRR
jgi:hypothetical protein